MGMISYKPEELTVDLPGFDRKLRYLMVAKLDRVHEPEVEKTISGSATGVPGGKNIRDQRELFEQFDLRIESETACFVPPSIHGDDGAPIPLRIDVRARNRSDFTGAGLRARRASASRRNAETQELDPEINQLFELNSMLELLLDQLAADPGGKQARAGVGSILSQMAQQLATEPPEENNDE